MVNMVYISIIHNQQGSYMIGTLNWTPIRYLYKSLKPQQLHALYAMSDVCIVSSVRDGLNLVSFEYVACQTSRNGVLLLSQYTGAAELLPSALHFNPWDLPRFADAIHSALEMPLKDRQEKHKSAIKVVETWTR
jgi:trehalose 6-phosphate synthase